MPTVTDEKFKLQNDWGRAGENLVRELITRFRLRLSTIPESELPYVFAVDDTAHALIEKVKSAGDNISEALFELINYAPAPNGWLALLNVDGVVNESRNYDFHTHGLLVETKRDKWFSGYTKPQPTFNICFEIHDHEKRPTGIYREHDYFCTVFGNKHGDPLFVTIDYTPRLRKFVEVWQTIRRPQFVGDDNSWSVLIRIADYLNATLPEIEED